jgi:exopolysaccharide production protein ExoZ
VPLYWAITTVVLLYHAGVAPDLAQWDLTWPNVIGSYFFVPVPRLTGAISPVVGVGWTLNYEMFFYTVFAVATLLSRRIAVIA